MASNSSSKQQQQGPAAKAKATGQPVHTGGGWYVLPNGSKVQGKAKAKAAAAKATGNGSSPGAPHILHNLAKAVHSPHNMQQAAAQQAACKALGTVGVQASPGALQASVWAYHISNGGKLWLGYGAKVGGQWHLAVQVGKHWYHRKASNFATFVGVARGLCAQLAPGGTGAQPKVKQVYNQRTSKRTAKLPPAVRKARKARKAKGSAKGKAS